MTSDQTMPELNEMLDDLRSVIEQRHQFFCNRHPERWPCPDMQASCAPACAECYFDAAPCAPIHALQGLEIALDACDNLVASTIDSPTEFSLGVVAAAEHITEVVREYLAAPTVY